MWRIAIKEIRLSNVTSYININTCILINNNFNNIIVIKLYKGIIKE